MDCNLPGSSFHEIFQGKNTSMGCHFLLQRIFLTQRSILCLMFPELAESFFTTSATWEAQAVSKGVFRGSCGLRMTLHSLLADG